MPEIDLKVHLVRFCPRWCDKFFVSLAQRQAPGKTANLIRRRWRTANRHNASITAAGGRVVQILHPAFALDALDRRVTTLMFSPADAQRLRRRRGRLICVLYRAALLCEFSRIGLPRHLRRCWLSAGRTGNAPVRRPSGEARPMQLDRFARSCSISIVKAPIYQARYFAA